MDNKSDDIHAIATPNSENGGFELQSYSKLGGTDADERDMQMLGRTQQLNVCDAQKKKSSPFERTLS
jgi:hypothetical protein